MTMTSNVIIWLSIVIVSVIGLPDNQEIFKACPINHNPQFFCCNHTNGEQFVYTLFRRPMDDPIYETYTREAWHNLPRQINYPYSRYTPNTPVFIYSNSTSVCRIRSFINKEKQFIQYVQCSDENKTLAEISQNSDLFMTYDGNPRNNNATCPDGAKWIHLTNTDGTVNTELLQRCQSSKQLKQLVPLINSYREWGLLLIYSVYLLFFISVSCFAIWKQKISKSTQRDKLCKIRLVDHQFLPNDISLGQDVNRTHSNLSLRRSELEMINESDDLIQIGLCDSSIGNFLLVSYYFLTIILFCLFIIVIFDNYSYFGQPLFLPGNPRMAMFIILFWIIAIWLTIAVIFKTKLKNFFCMTALLSNCQYVEIFQPDNGKLIIEDKSISHFVHLIESFFTRSKKKGVLETVKVYSTEKGYRYLQFHHLRYQYNPHKDKFIPASIPLGTTYFDIHQQAKGLTNHQYIQAKELLGENSIQIIMPSISSSLQEEFSHFFYVYQFLTYGVWYFMKQCWNASASVSVILIAATINIVMKRQVQSSIVKMSKNNSTIKVCRDSKWNVIPSKDLVPGDLIQVEKGAEMPCDAAIVQGSIICDESMLTGESMPVKKSPIPQGSYERYDAMNTSKSYSLFSGTQVMMSDSKEVVLAIVQTTGAHTCKGVLIRNILYPIPLKFKYDEHLKVLIMFLAMIALIATILVLDFLIENKNFSNRLSAFQYAILMLSGLINPLLPVVITIGQVSAANRLKKTNVFCLNPSRLSLAGKLRTICFDKTGTLTKQGLDFLGCKGVSEITKMLTPLIQAQEKLLKHHNFNFALASCHSLGYLNGSLVGNEVEKKMFQAINWDMKEEHGIIVLHGKEGEKLQVLKRYEFDHHRMSMSVVVRNLNDGQIFVFCKGSYEAIKEISNSETIPLDYTSTAQELAGEGYYVLGCAFKTLPLYDQNIDQFCLSRDEVENGLSLLGLILYRNELKPDTTGAIEKLKLGDTRVVMITGDNALCGIHIAKSCKLVSDHVNILLGDIDDISKPSIIWRSVQMEHSLTTEEVKKLIKVPNMSKIELAVTGSAFDFLNSRGEMEELILHTRIFARMTPQGKIQCIEMHMALGLITGMCGDGGNDCGALRAAHVGIALSDSEASVVSPFTSRSHSLMSVVEICREGRCSVATSFAGVKFLIMVGLVCCSVRFIQYYNSVILSEFGWMIIFSVNSLGLTFFMTRSRPVKELGPQRPTSSLIGPTTLISLLGQELIHAIGVYIGIRYLTHQPWYCSFNPVNVDLSKWWFLSDNVLATCTFFITIFQQTVAAFVFSFGSYYREAVWRNFGLCFLLLLLLSLNLYFMVGPVNVLTDLFRIARGTNVVGLPDIPLPDSFCQNLLIIITTNVLLVIFFEYFIVLGPVRTFVRQYFHKDCLNLRV